MDLPTDEIYATLSKHAPLAGEAFMTIAEKLHREGREEGLRQGLKNGERSILRKLLALKFGPLPLEFEARLDASDVDELERLAERVLNAQSLAAVFEG